jgi:hypothetical protein
MTALDALRRALEAAVAELPLTDLPALAGELRRAETLLTVRLLQPPPPAPELVDAAELGRRLGMSAQAVRDRARQGTVPVVPVCGPDFPQWTPNGHWRPHFGDRSRVSY